MAKQKNETTKNKVNNGPSLQPRDSDNAGNQLAATPFALMRRFSEEMNNLFQDFGIGRDWLTPSVGTDLPEGLWSPEVEVFEKDGELVVRADLPGLTRDDVKVELADDGVTIEGERKSEHEEKGEGFYRSERSYGKFYRRVPLPEGVKTQNAHANFRNGVLEITMPAAKPEERKSRRLEIRGEGHEQTKRKAA